MLVLARKEEERIIIRVPGRKEPITLKVLEIRPDKVRLGLVADQEVTIDREEVDNKKEYNN